MFRLRQEILADKNVTMARKAEMDKMLRAKVWTESKIRIRFPDQYFIQASFSPKEQIVGISKFLEKHVLNKQCPVKYYLYQTPPVVEITTEKTL